MNGLTSPKAGVADWPPGPTPRAARGAPEPSDGFAGILDSHQARTATAEGQDRSSKTRGRDRQEEAPVGNERAQSRSDAGRTRERRAPDGVDRERPVQHRGDDQAKAPTAADEAPVTEAPAGVAAVEGDAEQPKGDVAVVAEQAVQPVIVPVALLVQPAPAAPAGGEVVQIATATAQAPQGANVAAAAATPVQPVVKNEAVPAAPAQQAAAGAPAPTAQVQVAEGVPAEVLAKLSQEPANKAQAPAGERPAAPAQQASTQAAAAQPTANGASTDHAGGKQDGQPGTLPQQAAEQARTVAQAYGRVAEGSRQAPAEAPAIQPNPASGASSTTPAQQPAAGATAAGRATPVPLTRAAENVEHVLRLASSRGVTHARIALNPVELGSIDVHMRQTADGLVATVVAHAAESVQQLQNAAQDLRRSLEQQGLNLLSLDIAHSGDERSAGRAGSDADGDEPGAKAGSDAGSQSGAADDEPTVTTNLQLPNGVLVDVLA